MAKPLQIEANTGSSPTALEMQRRAAHDSLTEVTRVVADQERAMTWKRFQSM
jgi:hypothetical protein